MTEANLNSSLFSVLEGLAKVILKPLPCRELALFHGSRGVEILREVEGTTQDRSSTELLCGEAEGCD